MSLGLRRFCEWLRPKRRASLAKLGSELHFIPTPLLEELASMGVYRELLVARRSRSAPTLTLLAAKGV